jgi:release factor glutamine methyltransferase
VTIGAALLDGAARLHSAAVPEPRLTAEVLLAHVLARSRTWLMTWPDSELTKEAVGTYFELVAQRAGGRPTQYLTHSQEWFGRPFFVDSSVLIPRPETEHVVEKVLSLGLRPARLLDVGTGSGALAVTLALELPAAHVFATDISIEALSIARRNALTLRAAVSFVCCDLAAALRGPFDLIVANPPYVPDPEIEGLQREIREHEPLVALGGGPDGLDLYRRLLPQALDLLIPGGWLVMEIGYRSEPGLRAALTDGWAFAATGCDLAGLPRVMTLRKRQR